MLGVVAWGILFSAYLPANHPLLVIGFPTPVLLILYFVAVRMVFRFEQRQMARFVKAEADAMDHFGRYLNYLEQHRADEPFRVELVEYLWRDQPQATAMQRFRWLRCLIRRGEMDSRFLALVQSFGRIPGSQMALEDLLGVATQDHARSALKWDDRLSPETLRIAALAREWTGQPAEAVKLAGLADEMWTVRELILKTSTF